MHGASGGSFRTITESILSLDTLDLAIGPHEDREPALRYLATHIGRSHRRNLSPRERHEQIVAGQYGIGLLGFWSIGHRMEIRSRVGGGAIWTLRLIEDEPRAEVAPAPPAIDVPETFTEVVISELHAAASRPLAARRFAEYLGAELRGPLRASAVQLELREHDLRGQLVERNAVVPRRFEGLRLDVPAQVIDSGYPPIEVELYHAGNAATGVELTCAGTVVCERIADLAALGLDVTSWSSIVRVVDSAERCRSEQVSRVKWGARGELRGQDAHKGPTRRRDCVRDRRMMLR